MKLELPEIPPEELTPVVEMLLAIIRQLADRVAALEQINQQLRDAIARLKGQKPRPDIKPSVLEAAPKSKRQEGDKRPGSAKRPKLAELTIHREEPVHAEGLPEGSTFRCYEPYVVQELLIRSENTRYLRARYDLPTGGSVLAPFPNGVLPVAGGHFGPNLIAYILDQYHQAQVTEPLLVEQLWEYGIDISAGQLHRILTENHAVFHQEKDALRAAGLAVSSWIGTDDTGARHRGKNGYCTVIGNDLFAYFQSSDSKNRLNFLHVLQGKQHNYALNEATLAYWKRQELAEALIEKLSFGPPQFTDESAWQAWLVEVEITGERHVRIATEGALLGGLVERGVSPELVVLSDGAPQFDVFLHASCWIHAERPLARMVPYHEAHRAVIEKIRGQIWELYQDLKAYRQQPDAAQKPLLEARFDALCDQKTGYPSIDGVLKEIRDHKADLLRVLARPEVPLHNNGCESDIREYVKKRKISGSTRSPAGRRCRDTFTSLKKTCRKLGVNFWNYLQDRLRGLGKIPRLPDLIRERAMSCRASLGEAVPA